MPLEFYAGLADNTLIVLTVNLSLTAAVTSHVRRILSVHPTIVRSFQERKGLFLLDNPRLPVFTAK